VLGGFIFTRGISALAVLVVLVGLEVARASPFDPRVPMTLCLVELLANGVWAWWTRRGTALRALGHVQLTMDTALITAGIVWTGALSSPFIPLYVIVVLSAGLLGLSYALVHASLGSVAILVVLFLDPANRMAGPIVLTDITLLVLTAVVVSFFRAQTEAEQDKLRAVSETLRRAYDDLSLYERQQRELNESLQRTMRARSEFMALVSHELRTPLNSVIGFADLLLEPEVTVGEADRATFLEHIRKGGRKLLAIIDNIIDMARVDAGSIEQNLEPLEIGAAIEAACAARRREAEGRGIALETRVEEGIPVVMADPRRIQRVLAQLLDNAIRFTDRGTVEVGARGYDETCIVVFVRDHGPGIPEEQLERIFEPFHQVDSSIRRIHGGTGLGLALARAFVEVQGGRIWAESVEGRGATLSFTLPIAG
jgi:signal transduction histidine kinase